MLDVSAGLGTPAQLAELVCVECRLVSTGDAFAWRAYLAFDGELGVYCPECAEREFGRDEI